MTDLKNQLLFADLNSQEFTNLFTNLEIISRLNIYDKLNTNDPVFYIDNSSMIQFIVRYWYGSNRNSTITRLNEQVTILTDYVKKYFENLAIINSVPPSDVLPVPIVTLSHETISGSMISQPIPIPGTSYKSQELNQNNNLNKDDDAISMLSLNIGSYQNSYSGQKHKKKRKQKRKELIDHYYQEIVKQRSAEKNLSHIPHKVPNNTPNDFHRSENADNMNIETHENNINNSNNTSNNTIVNNINNNTNVNNIDIDMVSNQSENQTISKEYEDNCRKIISIIPYVIKGMNNLCITYQDDSQMITELKNIIARLESILTK